MRRNDLISTITSLLLLSHGLAVSKTCQGTWRHRETHHKNSNVMVAENDASLWVFSPSHKEEDDPVNLVLQYRPSPLERAWKYEFSCQSIPKLALSHTQGDIWALGCPSQQARLYNGNALTSKAGSVTLFQWNQTRSKARIVQTIFGKNSTDQLGTSIAMSADGQTIALVASAGTTAKEKRQDPNRSYLDVYRYDNESRKWQPLGSTFSGITKVALSSDGQLLTGMTSNKMLKVYSYNTDQSSWQEESIHAKSLRAESLSSMALSGNGQLLSLLQKVPGGQAVRLFRRIRQRNNQHVWRLDSSIPAPTATYGWVASLSRDGQRIALAEPSFGKGAGAVRVLDYNARTKAWTAVGEPIQGTYPDSLGRHIHLSQDGSQLIVKALAYTAIYQYQQDDGCSRNKGKQQRSRRDEL